MSTRYLAITEPYDRYSLGAPEYKFFPAKDDNEAVIHVLREEFEGDIHNEEAVVEFIEHMEAYNGDGRDFITIINLDSEQIIFGAIS